MFRMESSSVQGSEVVHGSIDPTVRCWFGRQRGAVWRPSAVTLLPAGRKSQVIVVVTAPLHSLTGVGAFRVRLHWPRKHSQTLVAWDFYCSWWNIAITLIDPANGLLVGLSFVVVAVSDMHPAEEGTFSKVSIW